MTGFPFQDDHCMEKKAYHGTRVQKCWERFPGVAAFPAFLGSAGDAARKKGRRRGRLSRKRLAGSRGLGLSPPSGLEGEPASAHKPAWIGQPESGKCQA